MGLLGSIFVFPEMKSLNSLISVMGPQSPCGLLLIEREPLIWPKREASEILR